MSFYKPYWYQQKAIDAALKIFESNIKRTLIVAPTGSGKSVIAACFCEQLISEWSRVQILIISSFQEILKQNFETLQKQMPNQNIGLYSASCGKKTIDQITIAGIKSIYKKPQLFDEFNIIIVDEAHLVSFELGTIYREFLDKLNKPTLGLTATHFRLKGGYLHKGKNAFFQNIAYETKIHTLQKEGRLCEVIGQGSKIKMDVSRIRKQAGDFVSKELSLEFDRVEMTKKIAFDLIRHKSLRRKWLGFAIDIKHSEHIADELNDLGVKTAVLHSKLTKRVKNNTIQSYRNNNYQCLVSVDMITIGFNVPDIDLIFVARPTLSPVLHVQMPGRGMRVFPGKENLLYLDYAGNLLRNGPIDNPKIPEPGERKRKGDPILRECPQCFLIVPVSIRICPRCSAEFQIKHKLTAAASDAPVLSKGEWHEVEQVSYDLKYSRKGNIPMLKVRYQCPLRSFSEYVLFDHGGYATAKARRWWEVRWKGSRIIQAESSEDALAHAAWLNEPVEIFVDESGKYPKISNYQFGE